MLRDGAVLEGGSYGWADRERRRPFARTTPTLICSITKQFTCAALLRTIPDREALRPLLQAMLPRLAPAAVPPVAALCHNQSGLRDYWALAMLLGAPPEGCFDQPAWRDLAGRTASLQFAPGTRYSYSNGNFRLVSDMLEERTGRGFDVLLRSAVLDPAGMGAKLAPDTAVPPGGTVGYEGDVESGFRPAVNRIRWTGDAALSASLDDMIAWERFIDRTRNDEDGIYRLLSAPVAFRDGSPAAYGNGLARFSRHGRLLTGHAGGLRGFRSFRLHSAADRVSVVVLFNHMGDPRAEALALFDAAVDAPSEPSTEAMADPALLGRFVDEESELATRLQPGKAGAVTLHHAPTPELLRPRVDGTLEGTATTIRHAHGRVWMARRGENVVTALHPAGGAVEAGPEIEGRYRNDELDATLSLVAAGGVVTGAFSGVLGEGAMERLIPFGADRFRLPCPRALDYAAPGDWTLRIRHDAAGLAASVEVGCWLARSLSFRRV